MKAKLTTLLFMISPVALAVKLTNPLGEGATFRTLLDKVFTSLYGILMVILPIIIIIGAFQMLFATGEPEKFKKGQRTIVYAVIGLVVVLLSKGIVAIVERIFQTGV